MRRSFIFLAFLYTTAVAFADSPPIRLPALPAAPAPQPVAADTPTRLTPDRLFVIDSDVPVVVLCSPAGVLKATTEEGPLRIRGLFADGGDKAETRTFRGKHVITVEVERSGACELIVVPMGLKSEGDIIRRRIDAGTAPQPPPPGPAPAPQPQPGEPSPFADFGLRCLIVYESADLAKMPAKQVAVLTSGQVRGYLNDRCATGGDGRTREWRVLDQNADVTNEGKVWQDALKRERRSLPWIVIGDGKTGYEGPLPADVNATLALLKKYGGE